MIRQLCRLPILVLLLVAAPGAFAGEDICANALGTPGLMKCTLSAGTSSVVVEWNLANGNLEEGDDAGFAISDDMDLSMNVDTTLHEGTRSVNVYLLSASIQDEFTNFGFKFKNGARGEVGRETIAKDRTPDEKDYHFVCTIE